MKSLTQKTTVLVLAITLLAYQGISYANQAPVFDDGDSTTRFVTTNYKTGWAFGERLWATDADGDTLMYSLGGTDAPLFTIDSSTGQLRTGAALDYTENSYEVTVTVSDGNGGSDTIDVTINVNQPPKFSNNLGTEYSIPEDVPKGTKIGAPFTATDEDGDPLTYVITPFGYIFWEYLLILDRFYLDPSTGQMKTDRNDIGLDAGTSLELKIAVVDRKGGQDIIVVTINVTAASSDDDNGAAPSNRLLDWLLDQENLRGLDSETLRTYLSALQLESDGSVKYQQAIALIGEILEETRPKQTLLFANYPNPFNPETWIPYQLANPSNVQVTIYNSRGTVVRQLELGHQPDGYYTSRSRAVYWDGRNDAGEPVASGTYFYQLRTDNASLLRKMVILK